MSRVPKSEKRIKRRERESRERRAGQGILILELPVVVNILVVLVVKSVTSVSVTSDSVRLMVRALNTMLNISVLPRETRILVEVTEIVVQTQVAMQKGRRPIGGSY